MTTLLPTPLEVAVASDLVDVAVAGDLAHVVRSRAESGGGGTFLRDARSQRRISFAELDDAAAWWEGWLATSGVGRGERVALCIADPLEFSRAYVAIIAAGRWAAPIDPAAPAAAVGSLLDRLQPAVVVSDRPELAAGLGSPVGGVPWYGTSGATLVARPPVVADGGRPQLPPAGGSGGALLFSSGSTGTPKLIQLHERQLLDGARAVATEHGFEAGDIGFSPLPLFHINAQVVGVLAALWAGSGLVVDSRFHRTDFWGLMERHQVTWINAVPAMISHLSTLRAGESVPGRIRFVRSASAPLPVATSHRFEAVTGIPVVETYGMTEAAGQIAANPMRGPRKPGSVGRPVGFELRIVAGEAPDGRPPLCDRPVPGHVEIRGRWVGQYGDARPPVQPIDDDISARWFSTGDLGYLDDDGYLFLVGRSDDVINRGGEKVYPREIEELLRVDPRVSDAVVIGRTHEALGMVPVAYVAVTGVTDRSGVSSALAVADLARVRLLEALPQGKRPVALNVVGRLPTTGNGKIARRQIESMDVDADVIATVTMP